jgi:MinD superfamily P-loop ATPase
VKAFAAAENLPILMEIPFDRRIAAAYSRGDMVVDVMPQWKAKFLALFDKIQVLAEL